MYRPAVNHPSLSINEQFDQFSELLTNLLSNFSSNNNNVFILGDFNLDVLRYNICSKATEYVETLFSHGFLQTIVKPTRCTSNSASLIDHCVTNFHSDIHKSTILTSKISDHFPVIYFASTLSNNAKTKLLPSRDFSTININKFKTVLSGINWNFVTDIDDPQLAYNVFSDFFNSMYELYFPVTNKKINKNFHKIEPWCTKGILISRKEKFRLSAISAKTPTLFNINKFKIFRNLYHKIVREAKRTFFETELLNCTSNATKSWNLICQALKKKPKKSSENVTFLKVNNIDVTDPSDMANHLNEFFTTAPSIIVNEIPPTPDVEEDEPARIPQPQDNVEPPLLNLTEPQISTHEVGLAFDLLEPKKSYDLNNLSMFF